MPYRIVARVLALFLGAAAAHAQPSPPRPPAAVAVTLVGEGAVLSWEQTSAANVVAVMRFRDGAQPRQVAGWLGSYAPEHIVYDDLHQPGDRYQIREQLILPTGAGAWSVDYGPYQIAAFLPQLGR